MTAEDFAAFKAALFAPKDDILDQLLEEPPDDLWDALPDFLIGLMSEWATVARDMPLKIHDKAVWRICSYPLFISQELFQWDSPSMAKPVELVHAAKYVTLSIPELHAPDAPMENGYFMWWDCLLHGVTNEEITQAALEVLSELSLHSDTRVQYAALHGLGHLQHPDRPAIVDEYRRRHPELATEPWIQDCRIGQIM